VAAALGRADDEAEPEPDRDGRFERPAETVRAG